MAWTASAWDCCGGLWSKISRRKPVDADMMTTPLSRCLSTCDLVLLGIGHMIGSGIYVVTGTVMLMVAGPSTTVSYALAGVVALLFGLCYAQFSVNIPKTGTCYVYVYLVGGELLAFLAGWNLLLDYTLSVASVGRSVSAYLDGLTGGAIVNSTAHILGGDDVGGEVLELDFVGPAFILLAFFVIALGARLTAYVNNSMVFVNIAVILVIIITAMLFGNVDNLTRGPGGFLPFGVSGTVSGMGMLFFAYLGFDAVATASEETKNPSRSLPIAFCVALTATILLYCSASFSLSLLVPYNEVVAEAPFPYAFTNYGIVWTKYCVALGATLGLSCSLLGQAYTMPRGIYALANDGFLFNILTYVNSRTKTPLIAIFLSACLSGVMAMLFPIHELIEMVSIGILFAMSLMVICLIKIHYMSPDDCPFEMQPKLFIPVHFAVEPSSEKEESAPILRGIGGTVARDTIGEIGQLRFRVPLLCNWNANTVTSVAIVVLSVSLMASSVTLGLAPSALSRGEWWAASLLATTATVSLCAFVVLLLYKHNTKFAKFKVRSAAFHF